MRRHQFQIILWAAAAALAFPFAADAQDPVIEKILFSVQDLDSKEIIAEIPADGDLVLEAGDRVRLRAIAVPIGKNRGRRYPSTSYELGNPSGMVSMSNMNSEQGSTVLEILRDHNRNKPNAVPFLRYKILEDLKIGSRMLTGNIYIRLGQTQEPAPPVTAPPTAEPNPNLGVTLFEHKDYRGKQAKFVTDVPNLRNTYFGQDIATSAKVDRGCRAILYEHPNYQGREIVLLGDAANLSGTSVRNDTVSSLRIDCTDRWRYEDRRQADPRDQSYRDRRGVTLFEHPDYQGRSETFYADDSQLRDNLIGQDSVSSVRVDPGCRAVLYEDSEFGGRASVFTEDEVYLGSSRVGNDRASSIEVRCDGAGDRREDRYGRRDRDPRDRRYDDRRYDDRRGGVVLFEDANFRGRSERFFDDDDRLNDNEIRQDEASSVRVDPGCEAVLYEHPNFQGRATVVTGDIENLRSSRVGNDSVSSIEVACQRRR